MKLSEAIRLGAMMTKQCYGPYSEDRSVFVTRLMGQVIGERVACATCAMGGALLAVGQEDRLRRCTDDVHPEEVFPVLSVCAPSPAYHTRPVGDGSVFSVIVDLNDEHQWSRERIADWVETVEAQLPQSVTEARLPEGEKEAPEADATPTLVEKEWA